MADDFTTLNTGAGGSSMDETGVTFPTTPTTRKRPRIILAGEAKDAIIQVVNEVPDETAYALPVRNIMGREHPGVVLYNFTATTLVPVGPEATVSSYTVPVNKAFYVTAFYVSGDVNARFCFYQASSQVIVVRTSVSKLTEEITFNVARPIATAGTTVSVKVAHGVTGVQANFEATILGYLVDV